MDMEADLGIDSIKRVEIMGALQERHPDLPRVEPQALAELRTLKGIIPICAHCKKVRDDAESWMRIESYLKTYWDVDFSHGYCPDCFAQASAAAPLEASRAARAAGADPRSAITAPVIYALIVALQLAGTAATLASRARATASR